MARMTLRPAGRRMKRSTRRGCQPYTAAGGGELGTVESGSTLGHGLKSEPGHSGSAGAVRGGFQRDRPRG